MVLQLNPCTTTGKTSIIIMILSWAALQWVSANDKTCCDKPDVQLTVACANGIAQLRWQTSEKATYGFAIIHGCNTNLICDHADDQKVFNRLSLRHSETNVGIPGMFAYNLTMSDFDNDTCWFWIKRNDEWDNNKIGCSPVYTCREELVNTVSMLSLSTISDDMMPSSSTPVIAPSMSILFSSIGGCYTGHFNEWLLGWTNRTLFYGCPLMPNITMPEAEETYAITAGGSITCTATGYPEPDVEWMNNDESVVDENTLVTKNIVTASSGNLYNVSVSMTISRNDAGNYTCVANNSVGEDIRTITVTVPSPPIITMPDSKQAYKIIDGDSITCIATGNPVPDIVWLSSDGSEVDESRLVTNSTMDTDINNIPSVSVSMTVRWSDDGNYTCRANNSIGSNASTVHIIVQHKTCCDKPDVKLTVACANGIAQLRWQTSERTTYGFAIIYGCNTNLICDHTDDQSVQRSILQYNQTYVGIPGMFAYNLTKSDFDNATCWFWIKRIYEWYDDEIGCSPVYTCSEEPVNTVSMLPSSTISDDIMPSSSTPFISPSISILSSSIFSSPSSSSVYLASYSLTTTVTASIIFTNIDTTTTASASAAKTRPPMLPSPTVSSSVVPSVEPQQNSFPDLYSLLLYITLCCAAIIFLLIAIFIFCCCWRKFKQKQSKKNYEIEDVCFEDPGELAKESDSETETLTNGGMGDDVSITDDHTYMLRKILRLDHDILSLDPSIFNVNEAYDGSVASHYRTDDGGVDCSHYCGSGGQYNTSSNHSSSSSVCDI